MMMLLYYHCSNRIFIGCVVAMTGPIDYVSDGERVYAIENGDPLLACITGSGCMVSSIVGCFTAGKALHTKD